MNPTGRDGPAGRSPHRVPPSFFGFSFGLSGLAETWATASHEGLAPRAAATAIAAVSGLVWAAVGLGYLRVLRQDRSVLRRDLLDPVAGPFLALALIAPMLCSVVAIAPYAPRTGRAVFDVFLVLSVLLGGWFTGQWIYRPLELDRIHPGYFLPTVAGGLVASDGAALLGQQRLAETLFGLGTISWLVMGSIILARLFVRPALPTPLLPTLAIEVAPAAVASLAWFDAHGDRIDVVSCFLAGYGVLMVIAQLRLLPVFVGLPFMPSTWAFTFSWAAVASASLHWLGDTRPTGMTLYEYAALSAITALVGGIAVRTVLAAARHELMPPVIVAATAPALSV